MQPLIGRLCSNSMNCLMLLSNNLIIHRCMHEGHSMSKIYVVALDNKYSRRYKAQSLRFKTDKILFVERFKKLFKYSRFVEQQLE